ncbi:MAG: hypothetical protein ACYS1A_17480 [Planctomycetota bacterium]|jgi:hypothetical protein
MDERDYIRVVAGELSERLIVSDIESKNWRNRVYAVVLDGWIRLIKKDDCSMIPTRHAALLKMQGRLESVYFDNVKNEHKKVAALEILALYNLSKYVEILANFVLHGGNKGEIKKSLKKLISHSLLACKCGELSELRSTIIKLSPYATIIIEER